MLELGAARGLEVVLVVVGCIIPVVDVRRLKSLGIAVIFLPGTPMQAIVLLAELKDEAGE